MDKFVVRLPAGMRGRITSVAKANRRSMNSEIVARLERSLGGVPIPEAELTDATKAALVPAKESTHLSEQEVHLVNLFRRLPDMKRVATLELLS